MTRLTKIDKIIFLFLCVTIYSSVRSDNDEMEFNKNININENLKDPDDICKKLKVAGSFVPDYKNCHNYYMCEYDDGELEASDVLSCPSGEYFNKNTLICEQEGEQCAKFNQPEIFAFESSCDPDLDCQTLGIIDSYVPDPLNCNNYYVCITVQGNLQASDASLPCPEEEYFNSNTLQCQNETTPCTNMKCSGDCSLSCKGDLDEVGFPGNCSAYYICTEGGELLLTDCPAERPYFDGNNCTTNFAKCCNFCSPYCETAGSEIPDPYDCHRFYICFAVGVPSEDTHTECSSGEIFDPRLPGCVSGTSCSPICEGFNPF